MVLLFVLAWRTRLPQLEITANLHTEPEVPPYARALWILLFVGWGALLAAVILASPLRQPVIGGVAVGIYAASVVVRIVAQRVQVRGFKQARKREGPDVAQWRRWRVIGRNELAVHEA